MHNAFRVTDASLKGLIALVNGSANVRWEIEKTQAGRRVIEPVAGTSGHRDITGIMSGRELDYYLLGVMMGIKLGKERVNAETKRVSD